MPSDVPARLRLCFDSLLLLDRPKHRLQFMLGLAHLFLALETLLAQPSILLYLVNRRQSGRSRLRVTKPDTRTCRIFVGCPVCVVVYTRVKTVIALACSDFLAFIDHDRADWPRLCRIANWFCNLERTSIFRNVI